MGIEIDQADASLRERNAPTGTWDEWRSTLDEYSDLGVERIYLQLIGGFDAQTLAEAVGALR